jgi:carboxymethylenebutenolidase
VDRRIIDLYCEYTHAPLPRRVFMQRLSALAGSAAAASALLPLLENNYAQAAIVPENDARLDVDRVSYPAPGGAIKGYLARAKGAPRSAGVLVIHENRGLNPHIEDVTRRVALAGYTALAPDLLSPIGGTPSDEDLARDMIGKLDIQAVVENLKAAVAFLKSRTDSNGKVGAMGFCWGGGPTNLFAVSDPGVAAVVTYYGRVPPVDLVKNIKARLLLHYAENDNSVNPGVPAFEAALQAAAVNYEKHVYPGAMHAFNNDTNAARYNKDAADLAWGRTLAFLKDNLG